jgi:hypothetical protein
VGTRTGNPVIEQTSNTGGGVLTGAVGNCEPVEKALASFDQQTSLGISADDVLGFSAGTHDTAIRWQTGGLAQFGPESGEHALTIAVTPRSHAYFVKYKQKTGGAEGGGLLTQSVQNCDDLAALEIDVKVAIDSDGGALHEQLEGRLRANDELWASLHFDLKPEQLKGELAVLSTKPAGFKLAQLAIDLGLSPIGLRGELSGVLEMRSADTATAAAGSAIAGAGGAFALIGVNASCDAAGLPVELSRMVRGFSAQDALDLAAATSTLDGVWDDGDAAQFHLQLDLGASPSVCALLDRSEPWQPTEPGTLRVHATLGLASDDQRLDGHWPVVLDAVPAADGSLERVSITLDQDRIGQPDPHAIESVYGLHGVDASAYDSVLAMLELEIVAGTPAASGTFKLTGLKQAPCAVEAPPPSTPMPGNSSGGSSPGCRGADLVDLASVTF